MKTENTKNTATVNKKTRKKLKTHNQKVYNDLKTREKRETMKKPRKIKQLNIHLTEETSQALFETEQKTHLTPQVIAQGLFEAYVRHWRARKKLTLPFEVTTEEHALEAETTENGFKATLKKT